ncbi:hypothetical protein [Longispora albida]|uniref:hypothetical protein n=1 Tax=Longispora albida TaxID=203523 RepID=UPI00036C22F0|nr:hypothetical protein [Longispora albida]
MTSLAISRLSATVRRAPDGADPGPRVSALLNGLANGGLAMALSSVSLPPGEWLVRRLDVPVALDLSGRDADVQERWALALLEALRAALGSGEAVHYPAAPAALADVLTGCATRTFTRAWAWRLLGFLPGTPATSPPPAAPVIVHSGTNADAASIPVRVTPGTAAPAPGDVPSGDPAGIAFSALRARPELAAAALVQVAAQIGWAALHRLFGTGYWPRIAALVYQASTGHSTLQPLAPVPEPGSAAHAVTEARANALLRHAPLAAHIHRSRLRIGARSADPSAESTLEAWAILLVASTEPAALAQHVTTGVAARVAELLASARPVPRVSPDREPVAEESVARGPVVQESAVRETRWAGLLFLIATAGEAGMPEELLADDVLAGRPVPWVLREIAGALVPAPRDDPAVLAFAGLDAARAGELDRLLAAGTKEKDRVAAHAARWAQATATRLAADPDEDPAAVVLGVAARHGLVFAEPGWIEVHLPLDSVDVGVRRAGLDVDPGWVPWLGSVVVFRYV